MTYILLDDPKSAVPLLEEARRSLGKVDPGLEAQYAAALDGIGSTEESCTVLRSALRQYPDDVGLWVELGRMYSSLARQPAAERAFRRALSYSPRDERARLGLSGIQISSGRDAEALDLLQPVGDLSSKLRINRAAALFNLDRTADAQRELSLALERAPELSTTVLLSAVKASPNVGWLDYWASSTNGIARRLVAIATGVALLVAVAMLAVRAVTTESDDYIWNLVAICVVALGILLSPVLAKVNIEKLGSIELQLPASSVHVGGSALIHPLSPFTSDDRSGVTQRFRSLLPLSIPGPSSFTITTDPMYQIIFLGWCPLCPEHPPTLACSGGAEPERPQKAPAEPMVKRPGSGGAQRIP